MPDRKVIRVLVVDESPSCRHAIETALAGAADILVVGAVSSGKSTLARIEQEAPNVLLLSAGLSDVAPGELAGQALQKVPSLGIIVTVKADGRIPPGAGLDRFASLVKPEGNCFEDVIEALRRRLLPKIRSVSTTAYSRIARGVSSAPASQATPATRNDAGARLPPQTAVELVAIGGSTGATDVLGRLLPALPPGFPAPILVAIHMPGLFTPSLATSLDGRSRLIVKEADDGEVPQPGSVYLAPGDCHLAVARGPQGQLLLRKLDDPPVNGCRPSVDVLFRSIAGAGPRGALALILTGMGNDGTEGLTALKRVQARVLAQDEASSVVWGMPGSAVGAGVVDEILPAEELAVGILRALKR